MDTLDTPWLDQREMAAWIRLVAVLELLPARWPDRPARRPAAYERQDTTNAPELM